MEEQDRETWGHTERTLTRWGTINERMSREEKNLETNGTAGVGQHDKKKCRGTSHKRNKNNKTDKNNGACPLSLSLSQRRSTVSEERCDSQIGLDGTGNGSARTWRNTIRETSSAQSSGGLPVACRRPPFHRAINVATTTAR